MDKDIKIIYEKLHNCYPIVLGSSRSLEFKGDLDFPVLHGQSVLGEFNLFFDGVSFAFYAMHDDGEIFAHWHLQTYLDAEETVADFMKGKLSVFNTGEKT